MPGMARDFPDMAEKLFRVLPELPVFGLLEPQSGAIAHELDHLQRSFSEDRPTRTSIIVMIQKRTTTWFSFQPFNS